MNFYIGDTKETISVEVENVELSDDLIDFVNKLSTQTPLDMDKLSGLNPYSDVEISKSNFPDIIEICNYILNGSLSLNYDYINEAI